MKKMMIMTLLILSTLVAQADPADDNFVKNYTKIIITENALDYALTVYAVNNGATEGNPILAHVVKNSIVFLAVKAVLTWGMVYSGSKFYTRTGKKWPARVVMFAYSALLVNNALVLAKMNRRSLPGPPELP